MLANTSCYRYYDHHVHACTDGLSPCLQSIIYPFWFSRALRCRYEDYPIADVLQMLGRATRPGIDKHGYVVLLCPSSKREYYKKFIFEPLPIESQLEQHLQDHVNAEVVLKTIESKQDAVDWLTWSFLYRRLSKAS